MTGGEDENHTFKTTVKEAFYYPYILYRYIALIQLLDTRLNNYS